MIDTNKLGIAMRELITRGLLEEVIVEDLKFTYGLCLEHDWEIKDALRKVLKYYLTEDAYKEFIEEYVGESRTN